MFGRKERFATTKELLEQYTEKFNSYHAQSMKEWAEDKSSYCFECKKHGDFLTLSMTRRIGETQNKYATTINLSSIKEINLIYGTAPKKESKTMVLVNEDLGFAYFTFKTELIDRKFVISIEEDSDSRRYCGPFYQGFVFLPALIPAMAEDDIVEFKGVLKVCIPHSLGQMVYDCILAEFENVH